MKKEFKSEQEVIDLIDRYLKEIVDRNNDIINLDHLAVQLRGTCEAGRILGIRTEIDTLMKSVAWREGRLENLKEILAEMRTIPLPFGPVAEATPTMEAE